MKKQRKSQIGNDVSNKKINRIDIQAFADRRNKKEILSRKIFLMERNQKDSHLHLFESLKWKGSFILYILSFFIVVLHIIASPFQWYCFYIRYIRKRNRLPVRALEVYLILVFVLLGLLLTRYTKLLSNPCVGLIICSIFIIESTSATLRDVFLAPNLHKSKIVVRNRQRWLTISLFSVFEIILSFSIIILNYKDEFIIVNQQSATYEVTWSILTAIYFSTVTFFTVGYGDVCPKSPFGERIILCELFCFLIFLILKIPMAVSMIKVDDSPKRGVRL